MPGSKHTHTHTQQKGITVTAGWCWVPSGSITACDPMISLLWRIIGQAVSICDTVSEKSRSLHSAHITFTAVNSLHISTETQERKPACSVKKHIRTVRYPRTSMFDSHSADIYSRMQIRKTKTGHPGKAHMNLHFQQMDETQTVCSQYLPSNFLADFPQWDEIKALCLLFSFFHFVLVIIIKSWCLGGTVWLFWNHLHLYACTFKWHGICRVMCTPDC